MKRTDVRQVIAVGPPSAKTNAGDEALVAEAVRLAEEVAPNVRISVLEQGRSVDHAQEEAGNPAAPAILEHPRRGSTGDGARDRPTTIMRMAAYGVIDYARYEGFIRVAKRPAAGRKLLTADQAVTYDLLRRASLFLVKGGGFLHALGSRTDPYYMWYQTWYIRLAHKLGVPVAILPNSYGPFDNTIATRIARNALRRCSLVTARESISAGIIGDIIKRPVRVFPDLAFFLPTADRRNGAALLKSYGIDNDGKKLVGITVRPYRFAGAKQTSQLYDKYINVMATFVKYLFCQGYHPILVTHVAGPSAHEDDREAIRSVIARSGADLDVTWVNGYYSFNELKDIYSCMDYLVGTRFHSCIFALSEGVPVIAIAYGGNKSAGIMNDLGLGKYVVDIHDISVSWLIKQFHDLVRESMLISRNILDSVHSMSNDRYQLINEVRNILSVGNRT